MFWSTPPQVKLPVSPPAKATAAILPDRRYGFDKAELGMSLGDWRQLSPRQGEAVCAGRGAEGRIIACSTGDVPLGAAYWARNPSYKFVDGKLVGIAFETSIDGFDYATAALKRSFGEPKQIVRDTVKLQNGAVLPHVSLTWRNGRSTIALSDPAIKGTALSVQFSLNDANLKILNAS